MDNRELCMALMRADTEREVIQLLREAGYWESPHVWRALGDDENNFATIGNQQSEAIAALVEKIVNGVDARLTHACLRAGIDPTSSRAPGSIKEAVARFFEEKNSPSERDGSITNWPAEMATAQGRILTVTATGNMPGAGRPSISIADQGEGQTPDSFPTTFMSLHRSNKLRILFVQGKFNMGGTGALQFCGDEFKVQLVVSRRDPALLNANASARDAQWGFTVVRREPPASGSRSSVFKYLAPFNAEQGHPGDVLAFPARTWPIFPEADASVRDGYARPAGYGSLVKLYEYAWQGTYSNIVSSGDGLLRRLDVGLPELALPIRLFECRSGYRGHGGSYATNVLGLVARLNENRSENLEPGPPITGVLTLEGLSIRLRAYVFRPDKARQYRNYRHGVLFSVNGQLHGAFTTEFFRRKSVRMGYLADSLLLVADCSDIEGQVREDLFMTSRDRLRDTSLSRTLESRLATFLKDNGTLRAIQNARRQEALANRLAEDKPLEDVLQGLLKNNPLLSKLLQQGLRLPSPFPPASSGGGPGRSGSFDPKRFPTYFRFHRKKDGETLRRTAYAGSRARVAFETDAEDDYFVRDIDPGVWNVRVKVDGKYLDAGDCTATGPRNGIAQLWIERLPSHVGIGDEVEFLVEVTDPSRVDAFRNPLALTVRLGPPDPGGNGRRTKGATKGKGDTGGAAALNLPAIIPVREESWPTHGFTEESALKIEAVGGSSDQDAGETYDFFVNIDNKYLRIAQKESRGADVVLLEKQFMYSLVLIGLAIVQDSYRTHESRSRIGVSQDSEMNVQELVATVSRAIAPILLPTLEAVGNLSMDDV